MFLSIFGFELRLRLWRPGFLFILVLMMAGGAGLAAIDALAFGSRGLAKVNQPYSVMLRMNSATLYGMIIPMLWFFDIVRRDGASGMGELVRTSPAADWIILAARFAAALVASSIIFAALAIGFEIGCLMPWVSDTLVGPIQWRAHAGAFAMLTLPNIFILGAISVLVAALTRGRLAIFLAVIGVFLVHAAGKMIAVLPNRLELAGWVDPFGLNSYGIVTRHWTRIERATQTVPLEGALASNRFAWTVGALIALLIATYLWSRRIGPAWRRPRRYAPSTLKPAPVNGSAARPAGMALAKRPRRLSIAPAPMPWYEPVLLRLRFELRGLFRNWIVVILMALPALLAFVVLKFGIDQSSGMPVLPVTASMAPNLAAAGAIPMLVLAMGFAGELIWNERQARIAEIIDATTPSSIIYIGTKLAALAILIALQLVILTAIGIGYQLWEGAPQINLSYYAASLGLDIWLPMLMISALAVLVHVLVANRILAHLVTFGVLLAIGSIALLGYDSSLLLYSATPQVKLSDMNGLGHFLVASSWFVAYWSAFAVFLVLLADLLLGRGSANSLMGRLRSVRRTMTPVMGTSLAVALLIFGLLGGVIWWNTRVLNSYETTFATEARSVAYERIYGSRLSELQPRVVDVDITLDLEPARRSFKAQGRMKLVNKGKQPIETIHVTFDRGFEVETLKLPGAEPSVRAACCNVYDVKLNTPLQPGASLELTYAGQVQKRGFVDGTDISSVLHNGTFLHNVEVMPSIGVDRGRFLKADRRRLVHGLEPIDDDAYERTPTARARNYIARDSDFIKFAITVSTAPDQIAVAPGYLKREWMKDGRRYFRYEMDKPILGFWAVVSARFKIARDKWNDVDLAVFHHPTHDAQVPRMITAMKRTLAYATKAYGPFQHRQMRIVEFPYGNFAQSFPNTVPFAEMAGFIADPDKLGVLDEVTSVTAHEVAHQWWAHQVVSADVPGATLLSETLAQYTALKVVEKMYGIETVRLRLKRDLDSYLKARGTGDKERTLSRVKVSQPHIAYNKGALAIYALDRAIGEDTVNRALARLVREHGGKSDPYPTAKDLVRLLKAEAGPSHTQLIADLFERITLWNLSVVKAQAKQLDGGKWQVDLDVVAHKTEADTDGRETNRPLDQKIGFGLYRFDPRKRGIGPANAISLQPLRVKSGSQKLTLIVNERPAFATIDPFQTLIQRRRILTIAKVEIAK